tara:strand:+ start:1172 stop:1474 length:303 start_codon:yes stop_codon:yes gene_type:complete
MGQIMPYLCGIQNAKPHKIHKHMKNLLSLISSETKRDLDSKAIAKLSKDIIKEIAINSQYSKEEAAAIWGGAPNYLETLHYYSKGANVKDLAINILNKLK